MLQRVKLRLVRILVQVTKPIQFKQLINYRGQISIFLCVIMTGMLGIVFLLTDTARIKAAELEIQNAADRSMRSVFADTQQELLSQYGIFASDFSGGRARDAFENYLVLNLEGDGRYRPWLLDLRVENAEITSVYNLNEPLIFKKQILEFMKYRGPVYLSLELYEKIKALKNLENVFLDEKNNAENAENAKNADDFNENGGSSGSKLIPPKNQNAISKYQKLLEDIFKLKGSILTEELSSLRDIDTLEQGDEKDDYTDLIDKIDSYYEVDGLDPISSDESVLSKLRSFLDILQNPLISTRDTLYIHEYVFHQFSYYTGSKENRELSRAEVEYLIFHNSTERMNVLAAQALIGGVRFAVRFMESFINNKIPDLEVRIFWSLMKGFYLSLDDLTRLLDSEYEKQYMGVEICDEYKNVKLTYNDYLRILLFTVNENTLLRRMQELLQANIHNDGQNDNSEFSLYECSTYAEGEVIVSIRLWFLPLLKLDRFGNQNIRGGRYYIRKKVYCGY